MNVLAYEDVRVMRPLVAALHAVCEPGEYVIFRSPFRWLRHDGKEGAGSHVLVQSLRETATCDGEHRWSKCLREAADAIEYWAARSDAFEKEYEQLKARVRNLAGS